MSIHESRWRTRMVTFTASVVVATMGAMALAATPAETIKSRQQGLKGLGAAMKTINDQLKTDAPDKAAIKSAGVKVKAAADNIGTWFPKGTGPEAGVETAAKPEIWSESADFAEKVKAFQAEAGKLVALTDAGNIDGVRDQVRPTGKSCGNCHEKYRVKKDS